MKDSEGETEALAKQTLDRLIAMKNDGRAQLVAYANLAIKDKEKANSVLKEALEPAFTRLSQFAKDVEKEPQNGSMSKLYVPTWDWQIAIENSKITVGADSEAICQRLIELTHSGIEPRQIDEAFQRLATLKFENGKFDEVVEVCKSGLAILKRSSGLNRLIASASIQQAKMEAAKAVAAGNMEVVKAAIAKKMEVAKAAIAEVDSETESRLRDLDGAVGVNMSADDKLVARQLVAMEQWASSYLKGQMAIEDKDFRSGIKWLQVAFTSTLPVQSESRVEAGQLLANCYSQIEQWDSAAQVLSECAAMMPNDRIISLNAASAWRRAGSLDRASEQMGKADDGTYLTAMENALLMASRPSSKVDMRALAAALKTARSRFDALPPEQQALLGAWKLELFEARVGGDDQSNILGKLEMLSEKYADVSELQSQVAVDFASFGRTEASNKAISRLEEIAERSQKIEDRVNLELVKTRVCVVKKDKDGALAVLQNAIKLMPERRLVFTKVAAQLEIRENRIEEAFELLSSVPDESLDFDTMVLLAGIADSVRIIQPEKSSQISSRFEGWIKNLKQSEGPEGTNWRYFAAERLVARFALQRNNPRLLDEASAYYKEIDARRPHWGVASALGAKIASMRAELSRQTSDSEEAIALWRRALRDGDNRVSTVMDLVTELDRLERKEEANAELQRISSLADSLVDVSKMAVSSALERGDFSEALAIAERFTTQKPDHVMGWILRSQATYAASSGLGVDEATQTQLREKAWSYLDQALLLSRALNVWDARFRFKMAIGDKSGAVTVLEEMLKEPSLREEVRFLEAARRYLALKDFGTVRKYLDSCLAFRSRLSPEFLAGVYLLYADLNIIVGDVEESLNSLREACNAVPRNQAIRERLAIALSRSDSFDWKEIDSLLSAEGATSKSKLASGLIALRRGDKTRQADAVNSLEQLSNSNESERLDAKRLLASHFALLWAGEIKGKQTKLPMENIESAMRLYEELLGERPFNAIDAALYVNLLLNVDAKVKESKTAVMEDYLDKAERALRQLESNTGSSAASLQLRVRMAIARGEEAKIEEVVNKWIQDAGELDSVREKDFLEIAGQTLIKLGRVKEAIVWLEQLYAKDPSRFKPLAVALAREKKFERAFEICLTANKAEPSLQAAKAITEVAMFQPEIDLPPEAMAVLSDGMAKYRDSAELLESIATVYLKQDKFIEAVGLYETVKKIDPKRVLTLNNLAMALSKMPMRQRDAISEIESAIKLYGPEPDLLDTLGQVQLANGHVKEAIATLMDVCRQRENGAFRLHLAQALMAQEDTVAAKEQWSLINQSELYLPDLTTDDKKFLETLNEQFGGKP